MIYTLNVNGRVSCIDLDADASCTPLSDYLANNLNGIIPSEIENLTFLTQLFLSQNQLSGNIQSQIGNLDNLTSLDIYNNQIDGDIPTSFSNLTNLERLSLGYNNLTGNIPSYLGSFSNLTYLQLTSNNMTRCYDESLNTLCSQLDYNTNAFISFGSNFDVPWESFCNFDFGTCSNLCNQNPNPQISIHQGDIYLEDACFGVILTSQNGSCYRLKVEDDGSFSSEMVSCP